MLLLLPVFAPLASAAPSPSIGPYNPWPSSTTPNTETVYGFRASNDGTPASSDSHVSFTLSSGLEYLSIEVPSGWTTHVYPAGTPQIWPCNGGSPFTPTYTLVEVKGEHPSNTNYNIKIHVRGSTAGQEWIMYRQTLYASNGGTPYRNPDSSDVYDQQGCPVGRAWITISAPTYDDADFASVSPPSGTKAPGSSVGSDVTVENTGTSTRSYWVGFSYRKPGDSSFYDLPPQQTATLSPGTTQTKTFTWTIPTDAPLGTYDTLAKIWHGYDAGSNSMISPSYDEEWRYDTFSVATTDDADFTSVSPPAGTKSPGSTATSDVVVQNTGSSTRAYWVGLSYRKPGDTSFYDLAPQQTSTLSPGATQTKTFTWSIPGDAPVGSYDTLTKIWHGYDAGSNSMVAPSFDEEWRYDTFTVATTDAAEIVSVSPPTGTKAPGTTITADVVAKNTGTSTRSYWVGFSYRKPGDSSFYDLPPQQTTTLSPGSTLAKTFTWTIPTDAPLGTYDTLTKIWHGYDAGSNSMISPSYDEEWRYDTFTVATTDAAEITSVSPPSGTKAPGTTITTEVVAKNTGTSTRSYWVGFSYRKPGDSSFYDLPPQQTTTLSPGGTQTKTFTWTIPTDAQLGSYDTLTKIWHGYNSASNQMAAPSYDEEWRYDTFIVATSDAAEITSVLPPSGTKAPGTTIATDVTVKNTGTSTRAYWVGFSYRNPGDVSFFDLAPQQTTTLSPGNSQTRTFSWTIPSDALPGTYDALTKIWHGYDAGSNSMISPSFDEEWRYDTFTVKTTDAAEITSVSPPAGGKAQGTTITTDVTTKNTGTSTRSYWVGFSYRKPGDASFYDLAPLQTSTLSPGGTQSKTFSWTIPTDAPTGTYDTLTKIWHGYDAGSNSMISPSYDEEWRHDTFSVTPDDVPDFSLPREYLSDDLGISVLKVTIQPEALWPVYGKPLDLAFAIENIGGRTARNIVISTSSPEARITSPTYPTSMFTGRETYVPSPPNVHVAALAPGETVYLSAIVEKQDPGSINFQWAVQEWGLGSPVTVVGSAPITFYSAPVIVAASSDRQAAERIQYDISDKTGWELRIVAPDAYAFREPAILIGTKGRNVHLDARINWEALAEDGHFVIFSAESGVPVLLAGAGDPSVLVATRFELTEAMAATLTSRGFNLMALLLPENPAPACAARVASRCTIATADTVIFVLEVAGLVALGPLGGAILLVAAIAAYSAVEHHEGTLATAAATTSASSQLQLDEWLKTHSIDRQSWKTYDGNAQYTTDSQGRQFFSGDGPRGKVALTEPELGRFKDAMFNELAISPQVLDEDGIPTGEAVGGRRAPSRPESDALIDGIVEKMKAAGRTHIDSYDYHFIKHCVLKLEPWCRDLFKSRIAPALVYDSAGAFQRLDVSKLDYDGALADHDKLVDSFLRDGGVSADNRLWRRTVEPYGSQITVIRSADGVAPVKLIVGPRGAASGGGLQMVTVHSLMDREEVLKESGEKIVRSIAKGVLKAGKSK